MNQPKKVFKSQLKAGGWREHCIGDSALVIECSHCHQLNKFSKKDVWKIIKHFIINIFN
jgi:hypothetical protein